MEYIISVNDMYGNTATLDRNLPLSVVESGALLEWYKAHFPELQFKVVTIIDEVPVTATTCTP